MIAGAGSREPPVCHRPLRAAVVGARIGRLHATALHRLPHTTLAWVCDTDRALAEHVAGACGSARATAAYADILAADDVDLVTLAVPHDLHFDFARRALEAGKHVAVEKPLCRTLEETERLIAIPRGAARLGVIFQNRYCEAASRFVDCVRCGTIGAVQLVSVSLKWFRAPGYYAGSPWRARWSTAGGGVLTTQAIHFLDLMQAAAGLPTSVEARIATRIHDIEVEDTAVVIGTLPGGGLFSAAATTACHPEEPAYVQVIGSRGSACLAECRGQMSFAASTHVEAAGVPPLARALAPLADLEPQDGIAPAQVSDDGHRRFFSAFATSILDGTPFATDEREALKTAILLDAIYRSARTGAAITIEARPAACRPAVPARSPQPGNPSGTSCPHP